MGINSIIQPKKVKKSKEVMTATTLEHKAVRTEKNCKRRGLPPALNLVEEHEQVRHGHLRRWPTNWQEEKYASMNASKHENRGRAGGKKPIRPQEVTFPLMHEISPKVLNKILVAASLKIKRVKRSPGFILQRVWNLKGRPLQFI